MQNNTKRRYAIVWDEDGDQCRERFSTRRKMIHWLKVLRTRITCGDKIEIIAYTK